MLTPFDGLIPTPGVTVEEATRRARELRSGAGRYQRGGGPPDVPPGWRRAEEPVLFRYRMESRGRTVSGVVGEAALDRLLPHEETIPERPVRPPAAVEIRPVLALTERPLPVLEAVGPEVVLGSGQGWSHTVTPVAPVSIEGPDLVIADGHHRCRAAGSESDGDGRILALVVGEDGAGLDGGAFHRVFPDAPPLPTAVPGFDVVETEPAATPGAIVWCTPEGALALHPSSEALERVIPEHRTVMAVVARDLLYPVLGLSERDASYAGSADRALEQMGAGAAALMPSVSPPDVIAAARRGALMPPKSTRFRPKPARGMVVRMSAGRFS